LKKKHHKNRSKLQTASCKLQAKKHHKNKRFAKGKTPQLQTASCKLQAKKHLGQNFLINSSTLAKIIKAADILPRDNIIEIGPGTGILTEALATKANQITALELDPDLIPKLKEKFASNPRVEIRKQDALTFNPSMEPYKLVANIPYYITSPILNHFLRKQPQKRRPTSMTLLVQHEVAKKICAKPGDLSVLALEVQIFGTPKIIAKVPPSHFRPSPKVNSAILQIDLFPKPLIQDQDLEKFITTIHKGFAHKRKKLSKNLGMEIPALPENIRAQELSIEDWTNLLKKV